MAGDNFLGGGQTDPGSALPGGEEGIEYLFAVLGRYARTAVRDGDDDLASNLAEALETVRSGKPALVDVVTANR